MRASYSAYDAFHKCGAKFKFKYLDKLVEVRANDDAARRGTDMHKSLEDYVNGTTNEWPASIPVQWRPYVNAVRALPQKFTEYRFAVNREFEVRPWDGAWLVGVFDVVAIAKGGLLVIDWKTGKHRVEHGTQAELYALLALLGEPDTEEVTVEFVYLDHPQQLVVPHVYGRADTPRLMKLWSDRFNVIENTVAEKMLEKPSPLCGWCGYSKRVGGPCRFGS